MYIENLSMKKFRCFAEERLKFNWPSYGKLAGIEGLRLPNVNLLIGANGIGKTTIFQALTMAALRPYLADNISGFRCPMVIRHNEEEASSGTSLLLSPADTALGSENEHYDVITTPHRATSTVRRKGSLQSLVANNRVVSWTKNLFLDEHPGYFMAAYGAGRRTEQVETYAGRSLGVRYQRVASLFDSNIGLLPISWACKQCQEKQRWGEVVGIVNKLLLPPVRLTTRYMDSGEPLFEYEGIDLPVSELSDGYRLFIGWLIDCITHLVRVLPERQKLTDAVGIVIVDEVDLFLSPAWQRTVLETLSKTFPRLQWFCSTHSALVAGSLEDDNIYMLESAGPYTSRVRRPTDAFEGKSVDEVLMQLFGLNQPRSPQLQRQLSDLADRAMQGDLEASLQYLRRLNEGSGQLR